MCGLKHAYRLDWRIPLSRVFEHIEEKGSIIGVSAGPHAAGSSFVELVRDDVRRREWLAIRFDGGDEGTRKASDIVDKLLVKLDLERSPYKEACGGPVYIGCGIDAGGSVHIADINIGTGFSHKDLHNIYYRLKAILNDKRVLLILNVNNMPEPDASWFSGVLWNEYLEQLCDIGLTLLFLAPPGCNKLLPRPHLLVTLPDEYVGEARVQALEDLAGHILAVCPQWDEAYARVAAEWHFNCFGATPALVLNALPNALLRAAGAVA